MTRILCHAKVWKTLFQAALLGAALVGCKKKPPPPPPPPEVDVVTVASTNLPVFDQWIGSLDGYVNADIRAQVTGYLMTQAYKEGSLVKKGDLLFQIDPRPFQAVRDQAAAKLEQDKAQAVKTELDVKRYTPLAKEQAISQETLDNAVQANLGALAQLKADEATLESAQVNFDFTRITSPIDGVAGLAQGQIGDLVSPGSGVLTTVSTIDPIRVYFNVPEASYVSYWRYHVNQPDTDLQIVLTDGSVYPTKGKLFFANRQIDPTTGTLQLAGLFSNADYFLRPGQYALVRAQIRTITNAILVPQRAVEELQDTYHVVVVDDQNKAHVKKVTVGDQNGADWVVEKGLNPGDRVVVEGTQKAKEGVVVSPKPYAPAAPQGRAAP